MPPVALLAQALLRIPSVTPNDNGCLAYIEAFLKPLGFECKRYDANGTSNLYAWWGEGEPNLCFLGHTDVVPPGPEGDWAFPPFSGHIENGKLYGRGACDMKGAIAAYLIALKEAIESGSVQGRLSLLLTSDEEGAATYGTTYALSKLQEEGIHISACLVGEPTNPTALGQMAKIGRRGSLNGTLTIHGQQGHVAYPHKARSPLPLLMDICQALQHTVFDDGDDAFDPTHLEFTSIDVGNSVANVIPARATARFNVRFNPHFTGPTLEAEIRRIVDQTAKPHSGLTWHLDSQVSGEAFLGGSEPLQQRMAQAVLSVCGTVPEMSTSGGTSDARFIHPMCPVIEFGLMSDQAHQINEHVHIADLEKLTAIYKAFIAG